MKQDLSPQALMCLAVADDIEAHPERFDMGTWGDCGTTYCVGGKAVLRADGPRQLRELVWQTQELQHADSLNRREWPIVRRAAELLGVPLEDDRAIRIVFFDTLRNAADTVKILRHLAVTGEVLCHDA